MRIFAMSGALRRGSHNTQLLQALIRAMPAGVEVDHGDWRDVPVYDADVEHAGRPAIVVDLKDRCAKSDAFLIATPEYNNSVPGGLKNVVDWMSRPEDDIERVFGGLPAGVVGATTGRWGTRIAQGAWFPIFMELGMVPFPSVVLYAQQADKAFDAEGNVVDASLQRRIDSYARAFSDFVAKHKR